MLHSRHFRSHTLNLKLSAFMQLSKVVLVYLTKLKSARPFELKRFGKSSENNRFKKKLGMTMSISHKPTSYRINILHAISVLHDSFHFFQK